MKRDKNSVCCNHNCNQGRTCPVRLGTYKPAEAVHQIVELQPKQMTRIETKDLSGPALDWAVAKCEELAVTIDTHHTTGICIFDTELLNMEVDSGAQYQPSTNWTQGGPIIEREQMDISFISPDTDSPGFWAANSLRPKSPRDYWPYGHGPTPLIAVMRCLIATKLGDSVKIPAELWGHITQSTKQKD